MGRTAIAAALAFWGAGAFAAGDDKRLVVVADGPDAESIAESVSARATGYASGDSDAFRGALGPAGLKALAAAAKHKGGGDFVSRARAAARKAHADRALVVRTEKGKKQVSVHAWVIDAQGSGPAEVDQDVHVDAAASSSDEADAVWGAVASSFPAPAPAPPPAPEPAAPAPPVLAPAAAAAPAEGAAAAPAGADAGGPVEVTPRAGEHTRAGSLASLGVRMEGGSRHFSYNDRLDSAGNTTALRPYDLFVAPVVKVEGEIDPFRNMRAPVLQGLGATASYAMAFGLSSQDEEGNHVGTSWNAFDVGLRERLVLGPTVILGIVAGYGETSFTFDNPSPSTEALPTVHYKYLRGGLDGRWVHGDLSVFGSFGYRDVLATGAFGGLFPRASVGGVDGTLGAAEQISKAFELSLEVEYARFFYSLEPQPGDPYVAGGALDEMASLSIGLTYLF